MSARHSDRIWLIAGGLAAVAILAIGWLLLVSPQRSQTATLNEQTGAEQVKVTSLQRKLVSLREQDRNKAKYAAELAENRKALPTTAATTDYVRQLHASAAATGVSVTNVSIGEPARITDAKGQVYGLEISLTVSGDTQNLERFLDQLQQVQPRAVLIGTANVSVPDQTEGGQAEKPTLAISLQAFVSPSAAGAPAPASPAAQ